MASPVKEAKLRAQQIWPGATVFRRGKGSIIHQHPTNPRRKMEETQAGGKGGSGWHFGDGPFDESHEVDTAWIDAHPIEDEPWQKKMLLADYNAYAFREETLGFDQGQLIEYVHPASGETVNFQPRPLEWTNDLSQIQQISAPAAVPASVDGDMLTWANAYGQGIDFQWETQTVRLMKYVNIASLADLGSPNATIIAGGNPLLRVGLIFQKSAGIEIWVDGELWDEKSNNPQSTFSNVEFRLDSETIWFFKAPKAWDYSDAGSVISPEMRLRKSGNSLFVEILTPWSWIEAATFPITVDVTIDPQVGHDDWDAHERRDGVGFSASEGFINFKSAADDSGFNAYAGGSILTVTGPVSGDTIDVSYVSVYINHPARDSIDCEIQCEATDDANDFNTEADIISRSYEATTASWVDINTGGGWQVSPSIVGSVGDVITDRPGWNSGQDLHVALFGHFNANGGNCQAYDYGANPARGLILHIEYTEGAGPQTISMGVATLESSAQGLNVIPGAKLVEMQEATLVGSPQALNVDAPFPAQTIPMTAPNLVSAPQALDVIPGAKSVQMSEATLVGAAQALSLILGGISISMSEATLVSAAQALAILKGGVSPQMSAATLVSAAQALGIIPGATSVQLGAVTLNGSPQSLSVVLAGSPQTIEMGYATLVSSPQTLVVITAGSPQMIEMSYAELVSSALGLTPIVGAIAIPMGPATLASLPQNLSVVTGGADQVISMVAATLVSSAQSLTPISGAVNVSMSPATLQALAQALSVQAGTVVLPMSAVTVQGLPQALNIESSVKISMQPVTLVGDPQSLIPIGGAVSVSLSAITLVASPQSLTVILFVPTPALLMIHDYLINILSITDKQPSEVLIEDALISDLADFIRSEYES